jgi:hypothetical protein
MKTLFIAALVGLLVVPVVGNANQAKYNQAERAAKAVLATGAGHLQIMEQFKNLMDAMDAQAKNAPDKQQKDWALGMKANYAETYNQQKIQFNKINKDYLKAVRNLCALFRSGWTGGPTVQSEFGVWVCTGLGRNEGKRGIIFDQRWLKR